jgi:hypothetical protein
MDEAPLNLLAKLDEAPREREQYENQRDIDNNVHWYLS